MKSKQVFVGNQKIASVSGSLKVNGLSVPGGAFGTRFAFKSRQA